MGLRMEKNIKNKKGLEAPSNLIIIILFLVFLSISIILAVYFGESIKASEAFQKVSNFGEIFGGL